MSGIRPSDIFLGSTTSRKYNPRTRGTVIYNFIEVYLIIIFISRNGGPVHVPLAHHALRGVPSSGGKGRGQPDTRHSGGQGEAPVPVP